MRTAEAWEAFLEVRTARFSARQNICGRPDVELHRCRQMHISAHMAFRYLVRVTAVKRFLQAGVAGNPGETKIRWMHV